MDVPGVECYEIESIVGQIGVELDLLRKISNKLGEGDGDGQGHPPPAFGDVAKQLLTLIATFNGMKSNPNLQHGSSQYILNPLKYCQSQVLCLRRLFSSVAHKSDEPATSRYAKAAARNGGGVEAVTMELLEAVIDIVQNFGHATKAHIKELQNALDEVRQIPPSLPNQARGSFTIINYGSGPQNVNSRDGVQCINTGLGQQWIPIFQGPVHFGPPAPPSTDSKGGR